MSHELAHVGGLLVPLVIVSWLPVHQGEGRLPRGEGQFQEYSWPADNVMGATLWAEMQGARIREVLLWG